MISTLRALGTLAIVACEAALLLVLCLIVASSPRWIIVLVAVWRGWI